MKIWSTIFWPPTSTKKRFSAVFEFNFQKEGANLNSLGFHFSGGRNHSAKLWNSPLPPQTRFFKRTCRRLKRLNPYLIRDHRQRHSRGSRGCCGTESPAAGQNQTTAHAFCRTLVVQGNKLHQTSRVGSAAWSSGAFRFNSRINQSIWPNLCKRAPFPTCSWLWPYSIELYMAPGSALLSE